MSILNAVPDKELFEQVADQLAIDESFVEKDWYVTQVIGVLGELHHDQFEIIFSGGTALSKAHGLLKRFSEDIDFRVLAPANRQGRSPLSGFKVAVLQRLREAGFPIGPEQVKARDENRFFAVDIEYESVFPRKEALRPHIQLELTVRGLQMPHRYLPVSSLVASAAGQSPEVKLIGCVNPVESAADKLSALAWRLPDRRRGGPYDDPTVVRHIHDLAILKDTALGDENFPILVKEAMQADNDRSKNNTSFSALSMQEKFGQMMGVLTEDKEYPREYALFVQGVSYAPEGETPDFEAGIEAIKTLAAAALDR